MLFRQPVFLLQKTKRTNLFSNTAFVLSNTIHTLINNERAKSKGIKMNIQHLESRLNGIQAEMAKVAQERHEKMTEYVTVKYGITFGETVARVGERSETFVLQGLVDMKQIGEKDHFFFFFAPHFKATNQNREEVELWNTFDLKIDGCPAPETSENQTMLKNLLNDLAVIQQELIALNEERNQALKAWKVATKNLHLGKSVFEQNGNEFLVFGFAKMTEIVSWKQSDVDVLCFPILPNGEVSRTWQVVRFDESNQVETRRLS